MAAQVEVEYDALEDNTPAGGVLADALALMKTTPAATLGAAVLPKRDVDPEDQNNPNVVWQVVPNSLDEMVAKKKRYLFGVSFVEVATACIMQIAVARQTGAPQELIKDLVFSIFVGYTVSRDWAVEYQNLHSSSVLRQFEIDGRIVDRADPMFAKNSWVNTSKMNATAAHMLAYLVVEAAPNGGALARLKSDKGTPFSDLSKKTAQGILITEMAKSIENNDREAARSFASEFGVLVKVIDLIFGANATDLATALAKAAKFKPAEF